MKYLYIVLLMTLSLIYACDESSNTDPGSVDGETSCFTIEELNISECPAMELTNMCRILTCHFNTSEVTADGTFPPCKSDENNCEFIDCNTVMCGGFLYTDINAGGNGLSLTFETSGGESVVMTCHAEGFLSSDCDDGMNLN